MKNKKIRKILFIILGIIFTIGLIFCIYINNLINNINFKDFEEETVVMDINDEIKEIDTEYLYNDIEQVDVNAIEWGKASGVIKNDKVTNILLLGVEAIGGGNGRTDCIMICTLDYETKAIKLTSIMRDTYLQIPGRKNNRINAAYSYGGVPLITQTIEETFGIDISGSVVVNFDSFEKVIDLLGGIDLEITQKEANYLNSSNYISNPKNRNLFKGINHLNGNQALGYSRVRKVEGLYGHSDFGRTGRQRAVLNAVFNKYKDKNIAELLSIADDLLKLVSTDLTKQNILDYATFALDSNISNIETLRIPLDKEYKGSNIDGMSVLVPNWSVNIKALHKFINDDEDVILN